MEKLTVKNEKVTRGNQITQSRLNVNITLNIDGLKVSNSQVKRLEKELKGLKEEVNLAQLCNLKQYDSLKIK